MDVALELAQNAKRPGRSALVDTDEGPQSGKMKALLTNRGWRVSRDSHNANAPRAEDV